MGLKAVGCHGGKYQRLNKGIRQPRCDTPSNESSSRFKLGSTQGNNDKKTTTKQMVHLESKRRRKETDKPPQQLHNAL